MPEKDSGKKYDWEGLKRFIDEEREEEREAATPLTPETLEGLEKVFDINSGHNMPGKIRLYSDSVAEDIKTRNEELLSRARSSVRPISGTLYRAIVLNVLGGLEEARRMGELLFSDRKTAEMLVHQFVDTCCITPASAGDESIRIIRIYSLSSREFTRTTKVTAYKYGEYPTLEDMDGVIAVVIKNWQGTIGAIAIREEPYW